ncbi:MAG: ATP-binding protein [Chloroflexota bacterium]|nr:ATP-binding protein [Chloroflexota bacterium]
MARADLLKQLLSGYQRRDDRAFRAAAEEIILEERKKHHMAVANELEAILGNRNGTTQLSGSLSAFDPPPQDPDRRTPLLQIKRPDRYLDDLVLAPGVRASLVRVMEEFSGWEILEANGLRPVRHILFCGPPGCGKTAAAEAMACELSLPLLYVRFDSVVSSLLGETSANLRRVFDYAQRGQWVVLFDEFDAIGRSRDDLSEHGEIKRVVNSYLQMMDGFAGRSLVVAATNFENALDPAIWRRFDDVVRFERPTVEQVMQLVRMRLRPLRFGDADVVRIADELTGAAFSDVERVCLDVRKACALAGNRTVRPEQVSVSLERWGERRRVLDLVAQATAPAVDRE